MVLWSQHQVTRVLAAREEVAKSWSQNFGCMGSSSLGRGNKVSSFSACGQGYSFLLQAMKLTKLSRTVNGFGLQAESILMLSSKPVNWFD